MDDRNLHFELHRNSKRILIPENFSFHEIMGYSFSRTSSVSEIQKLWNLSSRSSLCIIVLVQAATILHIVCN